jgi:hypothetical protein
VLARNSPLPLEDNDDEDGQILERALVKRLL